MHNINPFCLQDRICEDVPVLCLRTQGQLASHYQNPFYPPLYAGSFGEKILERVSSYQLQAFIICLLVEAIPWFG